MQKGNGFNIDILKKRREKIDRGAARIIFWTRIGTGSVSPSRSNEVALSYDRS